MALKQLITAEEYATLEGLQGAYKQNGDGYVLDLVPVKTVGTVDEVGELKRALARERVEKKEYKEKLDSLESGAVNDDKKKALKDKDLDKLTKAHDADLKTRDARLSSRDGFIKKQLINAMVNSTSAKLAGAKNAEALSPHVRSRLNVDFSGDEPELQILDKNGQPGSTMEILEKELLDTDYLAPILLGSKATGSGATGNDSVGGASTAKKFDEHTSAELVALHRNDPKQYDKLKAARNAAKK